MSFAWLKHYMPRSLYGRAALILLLPVVVLQLIVSVIFIERHVAGVTREMTTVTARELDFVIGQINASPTPQVALSGTRYAVDALNLRFAFVEPDTVPETDVGDWTDLSDRYVIDTFHQTLPVVQRIDLTNNANVRIFAQTDHGIALFQMDRRRLSARNPHQLLVYMLVFGVLMSLIASIYLRNQLRPITRLARAAEAFGRGRVVPYGPSGANEVRAAGNAFLDMRNRIERQIEQRTLMLSGVSHDLRTPLTRMKLGLSMLDHEDREPLERDVEDMQRLVDEFLNFAKGASEGDPEQTDPHALAAAIVDDCQRSGMSVTLAAPVGEGTVMVRPVAIRRAIENLLGNAVRYGSNAVLSVVLTEKSLRIRVEDDGPGIPADMRGEAIKPFSRLDPSRNQNKGSGVGLGLAIATDIARAHGGTLRLGESQTLGGLAADIIVAR